MNTVEEYLDHVRQLVQSVSTTQVERYEESILSPTRGNLRVRLRFSDDALLEISKAFVFADGELRWLSSRYHYQDPLGVLVFRYDNAPHHPEVETHPDHKHQHERILASTHPSIERLLQEIQTLRTPVS